MCDWVSEITTHICTKVLYMWQSTFGTKPNVGSDIVQVGNHGSLLLAGKPFWCCCYSDAAATLMMMRFPTCTMSLSTFGLVPNVLCHMYSTLVHVWNVPPVIDESATECNQSNEARISRPDKEQEYKKPVLNNEGLRVCEYRMCCIPVGEKSHGPRSTQEKKGGTTQLSHVLHPGG